MGYTDDLTKDLTNLKEQMENYMKRLNGGNLANNDSSLMIQIAESYYAAIEKCQKQEEESGTKSVFDDILNKISAFKDSIDKGDSDRVREAYEEFTKSADKMIMEVQRREMLMEVFKTDVKEMSIHEAKMKNLQNIVDMDIKLYGSVSRETLEVLDVQHCELADNHLVQEKYEHDIEMTEEANKEADKKEQEAEDKVLNSSDILILKFPKMDARQRKDTENMLYQAGARYNKYIIPAEKSRSHEEISGRTWYVRLTNCCPSD